jgi:hypothetical protein
VVGCPSNGRPPREHLKLARHRTTIKPHMGSQRFCSVHVRDSLGKISLDLALRLVRGFKRVHYTCCARLLVVRRGCVELLQAAVEPCHQVAVGGAGGREFVVAVLELMATVEELLFEFGDPLPDGADFVGSREAGVVEDLFAEDFG